MHIKRILAILLAALVLLGVLAAAAGAVEVPAPVTVETPAPVNIFDFSALKQVWSPNAAALEVAVNVLTFLGILTLPPFNVPIWLTVAVLKALA